MNRQRIYSVVGGKLNEEDRLEICNKLIKAGYTARIGREREGGKGSYTYFVEFWIEEGEYEKK